MVALTYLAVKQKTRYFSGLYFAVLIFHNCPMDFADFLQSMGNNLRKARWAAGLTQEQVAARGISYRYYQELERGQRNPTLRTLSEIAQILGVPVVALVEVESGEKVRKRVTLAELDAVAPKRGRRPRSKQGD
jgi:transcriptional regulator with XRE-family HTH domain